MSSPKGFRFLQIGSGPWGQKVHQAFLRHPEVAEVRWIQQQEQLPRALADSGPWQGLAITTPASTLKALLREGLHFGLPIWVEKPLRLSAEEARLLTQGNPKSEILVDHIYLFHPAYQLMKKEIKDSGAKILSVSSVGGNQGPDRRDCSALWDYGVHDVALLMDLLGPERPVKILSCRQQAEVAEAQQGFGVFDLRLSFGAIEAQILCGNRFTQKRRRLLVKTDLGQWEFREEPQARLTFSDSRGETQRSLVQKTPLEQAVETFIAGVKGVHDESWGLELAVQVSELLGAAESQLERVGAESGA